MAYVYKKTHKTISITSKPGSYSWTWNVNRHKFPCCCLSTQTCSFSPAVALTWDKQLDGSTKTSLLMCHEALKTSKYQLDGKHHTEFSFDNSCWHFVAEILNILNIIS